MMIRTRFATGQIYGTSFLKIDWDNRIYILQRENWDDEDHPSAWHDTDHTCMPEEVWDWLPEQ